MKIGNGHASLPGPLFQDDWRDAAAEKNFLHSRAIF
jgi:hypothetical protein